MSASPQVTSAHPRQAGAQQHTYWTVERLGRTPGDPATAVEGYVVQESTVSVYVNAQELATVMCSPFELDTLALGFLYNEGVIAALDDVRLLTVNRERSAVDIYLYNAQVTLPRRMVLTSGCGGGRASEALVENFAPLDTPFATTPEALFDRMKDLQAEAELYQQTGGIHTSVVCTPERMVHSAEDIGRHNTIDRLAGKLLHDRPRAADLLLLTSGRVSSEMLTKARRMEITIVASRTSPTSLAVHLAQAWNICLVGYARRHRLRIYTHPQRLGVSSER